MVYACLPLMRGEYACVTSRASGLHQLQRYRTAGAAKTADRCRTIVVGRRPDGWEVEQRHEPPPCPGSRTAGRGLGGARSRRTSEGVTGLWYRVGFRIAGPAPADSRPDDI